MRNQRDGLSQMLDSPLCQEWLLGVDQSDGIHSRNVLRKHDDEFLPGKVRGEPDLFDDAMRHGGSYRAAI
jgi:hypothetical protein